MPRHVETRRLPYTPQQMFDLVADVARYPEFLPWVSAARVKDGGVAELVIGFGGLTERFASRLIKERPTRLVAEYVNGPLKFLDNEWSFASDGSGGCVLGFRIDFAFRSRILDAMANRVFDRAVRHMIVAFERRAAQLYGVTASGISSSKAHSAA